MISGENLDNERATNSAIRAELRDPSTAPARLRELIQYRTDTSPEQRRIIAAIVSNPNIPIDLLGQCLRYAPGAFCRNPASQKLKLNEPLPSTPSFILGLGRMLRSARAPILLIKQIAAQKSQPYLAELAQAHVAYNGELAPERCEEALSQYWRSALAAEDNDLQGRLIQKWFELGLATAVLRVLLPAEKADFRSMWRSLTGHNSATIEGRWDNELQIFFDFYKNSPSDDGRKRLSNAAIRLAFIQQESEMIVDASGAIFLLRTLALLRAPDMARRQRLPQYVESPVWQDRVAAALAIGPRPNGAPPRPKHQALLRRLAEDGNRYVRAVARRRIAEPGWVFPYF